MREPKRENIVLTIEETNKAKEFAEKLSVKKFPFWSSRDKTLTLAKTTENLYRGKCGEIAVYKYFTDRDYTVTPVDFEILDNPKHDADLIVMGHGIRLHIKTCLKNFGSWSFEKKADYIENPTARDFNCLVKQIDYDIYNIISIRNTSDYKYEKPLKYMPTKTCIYENTL